MSERADHAQGDDAPRIDTPEPLHRRTFRHRSLRGSRFVECDLSEVVVRGSDLSGMELDSPWLLEGRGALLVNGVDVVPLVDAELNRRFPGRELRTARSPDGLQAAWAVLERAWSSLLARAAAMPPGTVDASVDGEWSLAQTLRHLVMATDTWLGKAILQEEQPYHPLGLPNDEGDQRSSAYDPAVFSQTDPSWTEVLAVRSDRQARVAHFLAAVTEDELAEPRRNPHDPAHEETVHSCVRTILEEEWGHLRYATRDVDTLARRPDEKE